MRLVTLLTPLMLCLIGTAATAAVAIKPGEYVVFYHHDVLGSPVAATNEQGQVIWYEHNEAYGRSRGRINQSGAPYGDNALEEANARQGYTGHTKDNSAGLTYMKARYYDERIGRFLSNDPVGFSTGSPMMLNRYTYANSNPYNFLDPEGRDARDVQIILQDISVKFPGMRSPNSVVYKELPEGVAGQATLDANNPSLVLPTEAETATLSKDEFDLLYDTILHESMHLTDPFWQRVWDGIWGEKNLTKNHQKIYARESYEGIQPNGKPVDDVWDKDGTVEKPKGINPSELYDETRKEESSEDAE